MKFESNVMVL